MKKILLSFFVLYSCAQGGKSDQALEIIDSQCSELFNQYASKEIPYQHDQKVLEKLKYILLMGKELNVAPVKLNNVIIPSCGDAVSSDNECELSIVEVAAGSGWPVTVGFLLDSGVNSYNLSKIFTFYSKKNRYYSEKKWRPKTSAIGSTWTEQKEFYSERYNQGANQIKSLLQLQSKGDVYSAGAYLASLMCLKMDGYENSGEIEKSLMALIKKFQIPAESLSGCYNISLHADTEPNANILGFMVFSGEARLTQELIEYGLDPSNLNKEHEKVKNLFPQNTLYSEEQFDAVVRLLQAQKKFKDNSECKLLLKKHKSRKHKKNKLNL